MKEFGYERRLNANEGKPIFQDEHHPLNHVWTLAMDRKLALAETNEEEDRVLKGYRRALLREMLA